MQQKGCPGLPDDVPEWQTPHLAKPPPEEEDEELDEEAAEAKMQEERLAVGEGLVGDLAIVRTKREYSPDGSQDSQEPGSKKQRVGVLALMPWLCPHSLRLRCLCAFALAYCCAAVSPNASVANLTAFMSSCYSITTLVKHHVQLWGL